MKIVKHQLREGTHLWMTNGTRVCVVPLLELSVPIETTVEEALRVLEVKKNSFVVALQDASRVNPHPLIFLETTSSIRGNMVPSDFSSSPKEQQITIFERTSPVHFPDAPDVFTVFGMVLHPTDFVWADWSPKCSPQTSMDVQFVSDVSNMLSIRAQDYTFKGAWQRFVSAVSERCADRPSVKILKTYFGKCLDMLKTPRVRKRHSDSRGSRIIGTHRKHLLEPLYEMMTDVSIEEATSETSPQELELKVDFIQDELCSPSHLKGFRDGKHPYRPPWMEFCGFGATAEESLEELELLVNSKMELLREQERACALNLEMNCDLLDLEGQGSLQLSLVRFTKTSTLFDATTGQWNSFFLASLCLLPETFKYGVSSNACNGSSRQSKAN